ncbi:prefoldin subunit 5 [Schistocerca americana]|uniref:prefoldin subunit 5 n=1 Tax=Schistocerca americana TaxID=7009 RepID=UPI001F4FFCBC|nr:prefoldin subunit 5 [Schistocerca americana]XP_047100456.1 prefoldin subunit 5 [Schistocerca piceifrons]XP_049770877.1 prefoldin subunit 5 [Schistocerca cancellata]XP_049797856.1 prefoldin subunit 5 [Schistocerca nitens]XP_049842229.1 prefoldin subunit 5 [Schistocerca gregaria]XP_049946312.1 prefoldin subunit 5 [Schistocerca serialis cubense]
MASKKQPQMQEIDLTKLNLQQLTQLKQQLDQELTLFQESLQTLKLAQNKFQDSLESLEPVNSSLKDKPILVPLTSSIYVPGTVMDHEKVVIDIGTGYYIEKDIDGAKDYFKRKVDFVTQQLEKLQGVMIEKAKVREAVMEVMEAQLQAQLGAQLAAAQQAAVKT